MTQSFLYNDDTYLYKIAVFDIGGSKGLAKYAKQLVIGSAVAIFLYDGIFIISYQKRNL